MKVPFFRLRLSALEKEWVRKVLDSGWVTSGPAAREFENRVKKMVGVSHAVALSSGTAGLHLALAAFNIGGGDEVITSPYTMAATVEAILYTGARPILADIDPVTLNIDVAAVEKRITPRTKAVIAVDIAGWPCDYTRLRGLARKYRLHLIADAAHSLGARYRGKPVGTLADATVFSFYSTKNITTGEGGMVVTNSGSLAKKVRHLSLHGMTSSGWKRYSGGGWKYDITALGYKYNLSDLAAGLGLGQLARFEALQKRREHLARRYLKVLAPLQEYIELPHIDSQSQHAWHLFIIKINPGKWTIGRDRLIAELERVGVGCGVHFIPLYRFSFFKKNLALKVADYPACEMAFRRVISLPFYPDLTDSEIDYVCRAIARLVAKYSR